MALFRCGSGGSSGGGYNYLKTENLSVSSKNANITGLTPGKSYIIILAFSWSNTNYSAELASAGGTSNLTKIESGQEKVSSSVAAYLNHSAYSFTATSSLASLQFSSSSNSFNCRVYVFESV